ncbi:MULTISPECIES: DUF6756 family protein [Nostocaceae]|uniref:DUF6756 family protein n=1 Tax=Nostocaceae TaxID=1162 RepID=UPI0037BFA906
MENAAFELGIVISKLQIEEVIEIRRKLAQKFSKEPESFWRLSYQNLKETQSINDSKAWSYVQDYVGEKEVILFVNPDEEQEMWSIPSGKALTSILSETIGFPFYVTSQDTDYMLCFDDHDCLIATEKPWNGYVNCAMMSFHHNLI